MYLSRRAGLVLLVCGLLATACAATDSPRRLLQMGEGEVDPAAVGAFQQQQAFEEPAATAAAVAAGVFGVPTLVPIIENPQVDAAATPVEDPAVAAAADPTTASPLVDPAYVAYIANEDQATTAAAPSGRVAIKGRNRSKFVLAPRPNPRVDFEYIITLVEGADLATSIEGLLTKVAGSIKKTSWSFPGFNGFTVRVPAVNAAVFLQALADDVRVASITENSMVRMSQTTQRSATWGLDRIDQSARPLNSAYSYWSDGSGAYVYVIDTGISPHSDFGNRLLSGASAFGTTADNNGHGTHCAGTIGGRTWGVAKACSLVPVKVLGSNGSGAIDVIIAGINWVVSDTRIANAKKVINLSLGGGASAALDNAVNAAVNAGVTVVAAAGNENQDACRVSPARVPNAITVGATDRNDVRASFSNWGTCVDVFAPGVGIDSTSRNGGVVGLSGTSMAAPHVAGVAARIISRFTCSNGPMNACIRSVIPQRATVNVVSRVGTGSPNRLLFWANNQ